MTADPFSLADDLDEHLADAFRPTDSPPEADEDRAAFTIDDDSAAEWAGRKLTVAARRLAEIDTLAARAMDRIDAWRTGQADPLRRDIGFFERLLVDYASRQRDESGRKSVEVPSVKVSSRSVGATVQVTDGALVAEILGDDHPAVKLERKVLVGELKKVLVHGLALWHDDELVGVSHDAGATFHDASGELLSYRLHGDVVVDTADGSVLAGASVTAVLVESGSGLIVSGVEDVPARVSFTVSPRAL